MLLIMLQYMKANASIRGEEAKHCNDVQNSFISSVITWQNTRVEIKHNLLISAVRTLLTVLGTFAKEVRKSMDYARQHPAWLNLSRIISLIFNTH